MRVTVYIATSLDGFIARPDGSLDWLEHDSGQDDYGWSAFFGSVDVLVMGRNTFDVVVAFGEWPYQGKRVIVLSRTLENLPDGYGDRAEIASASPADLVARLDAEGAKHLYVDGGLVVQAFLRAGLVDELIITRMPILIGQGIPLFGALQADIHLKHLDTRSYDSGLVQCTYRPNTTPPPRVSER